MEDKKIIKKYSLIAGIGYLALFFLAIFANFMVFENFVVKDNAALTVENISNNDFKYRLGVIAFLFIAIIDIVIAWTLYYIFKPINKRLSLLAAWFRLVYTTILGFLILNLTMVSYLLNSSNKYLLDFTPNQLNALVMIFLNGFNYGWIIGLSIFGLHLITLGYLIYKSKYITKYLGFVLIIAGFAYIVDTFANLLLVNYLDYSNIFLMIVAIPAVIAEFWFTIWLLIKGVKK